MSPVANEKKTTFFKYNVGVIKINLSFTSDLL